MIVEAKEDVLVLSGSLTQNYWETIRTAATLLLKRHPSGIVIDCGQLNEDAVTIEGVETFRDALNYIVSKNARIIVAKVPEKVREALTQVPGVRSQLPIADSVDAARASLHLSEETEKEMLPSTTHGLLLSISDSKDDEYQALRLSCMIANYRKAPVHLIYCIEIPRALPIGAPLPEKEAHARLALEDVERLAKKQGVAVIRHVQRTRDWSETLVRLANELNIETLVVTIPTVIDPSHDVTPRIVSLLRSAPCEVIIYRAKKSS